MCSWLIFNLEDTIAKNVLILVNASEIWKELEERFGYASMTQVYTSEQKLSEMTQGSQNIAEFFTNIKTIWHTLNDAHPLPTCTCNKCTCNLSKKIVDRQQEQRLIQFMMKLNEPYSAVRGSVLMLQPLPKITITQDRNISSKV